MKRLVSLLLVACTLYSGAYAHALWIETNAEGKKGVAQQVKIFYGEYSENAPEKIADWYSDVKDFKIWLVAPGKEKVILEVTPSEDHFTCSFTPEANGVYSLFISHEAKKLGGKTKYQFNASAVVNVGSANESIAARNENPLKFSYDHNAVDKPVTVKALFNEAPAEKFTTAVFSPKGWTIQINGKEGLAQFTPEWKGRYMIEISNRSEEKGEHHGAAYEAVWRAATRLVEVR